MHVRALGGILSGRGRSFDHLHFKLNREILRRIAGSIVTSLVAEAAAELVFAGKYSRQRPHAHAQGEISAVNVELLIGSEGEAHLLAWGMYYYQ